MPLLAVAGPLALAWSRERQNAVEQLRTSLDLLHEHARRAFETQDALLAVLQWQTRAQSWEQIAGSDELADMLRYLARNTPGTSNIGIVNPAGRHTQIAAATFPPPDIDYSDRDYVRHQQGDAAGPFLSRPLVSRLRGRHVFAYSWPRLDAAGRPDGGVFWTTFTREDFHAVYAALLDGTRDEIALLRSNDGAILVSHRPAGQQPPTDAAGLAAAARAALAAPGRIALVEGVSPFDGEVRLYAARSLQGDAPAVVVRGLHPAGAVAAWRRQAMSLAAVAAAMALVLFYLTWRVRRGALRETEALAQGRAEAERRAEAEAALRQTQRLRVLGEVVAGVAHDFRNTVQAVQGGTILARKAIENNDRPRALTLLGMMADTAGRGAELTERMLRVARRDGGDDGRQSTFDPATALATVAKLLARTLPAAHPVSLDIRRDGLPARVNGRQAEFEAAVLNLAFNARDAMPEGGTIAISLAGEPPQAEPAGRLGELRRDLPHARLSVIDTGIGMDAVTLAKVAEPFFTTKPPGQGTGLGLASVRDFARTAGGALRVESPGPGRGTTVTLWLPEAWTEPAR